MLNPGQTEWSQTVRASITGSASRAIQSPNDNTQFVIEKQSNIDVCVLVHCAHNTNGSGHDLENLELRLPRREMFGRKTNGTSNKFKFVAWPVTGWTYLAGKHSIRIWQSKFSISEIPNDTVPAVEQFLLSHFFHFCIHFRLASPSIWSAFYFCRSQQRSPSKKMIYQKKKGCTTGFETIGTKLSSPSVWKTLISLPLASANS